MLSNSKIKEEIGKPKMEYKSFEVDHDIYEEIENNFFPIFTDLRFAY